MLPHLLRDVRDYGLALLRQWKTLIVGAAFTIGFAIIPAITGAIVPPWLWAFVVALAILPASFLAWRGERRRVEGLTRELEEPLELDIEATDIQYGPVGTGPLQGWQVVFSRFRVTNRSSKHRVSLRFHLQVALLNYPTPVLAAGAAEEDLRKVSQGEILPNAIASPLALGCEETRIGPLHLVLPLGIALVMEKVEVDPSGTHILGVHDYVSGKFLEIPIRNRTTGNVVQLPPSVTLRIPTRLEGLGP